LESGDGSENNENIQNDLNVKINNIEYSDSENQSINEKINRNNFFNNKFNERKNSYIPNSKINEIECKNVALSVGEMGHGRWVLIRI
jgi:hypothetical protein